MKTYTITESKTQLSALVQQVMETGEAVVIGRGGKPMVQLTPYMPSKPGSPIGLFEGEIHLSDDFDSWGEDEQKALGMI